MAFTLQSIFLSYTLYFMKTKKTIVLAPEVVGVCTLRLPLVLSDEQFSTLDPVFDLYNQA